MTDQTVKVFLTDVETNPPLATVDDITLERGAQKPTEITADQAERLGAIVELSEYVEGGDRYDAMSVKALSTEMADRGVHAEGRKKGDLQAALRAADQAAAAAQND